jgi:hypothetical protein
MDMLDLHGEDLYFDEPLRSATRACLDQAAVDYGRERAESALLRAYFLEPRHPMVLVALYRYFYYQHRLDDALLVADRLLQAFAERLSWPSRWQDLAAEHLDQAKLEWVRFYLLALKGAGYLQLRLGNRGEGTARLRKVTELDSHDRLGASALLEVVQNSGDAGAGDLDDHLPHEESR